MDNRIKKLEDKKGEKENEDDWPELRSMGDGDVIMMRDIEDK